MRLKTWIATALFIVVSMSPLFAHDPKKEMSAEEKAGMEAWHKYMTPGDAHHMLNNMVGTFDATTTMWMAPGAPPATSKGVSVVRWILGNRYIEQRFKGTFMNMPFEGLGYTGYDNAKKQYWGTWMDSMSTGVMTSTGSTSDGGKTWKFASMGTDPMTGKDTPGEMTITVKDRDHHTMEMSGPAPDGSMFKMMEINYHRRPAAKK